MYSSLGVAAWDDRLLHDPESIWLLAESCRLRGVFPPALWLPMEFCRLSMIRLPPRALLRRPNRDCSEFWGLNAARWLFNGSQHFWSLWEKTISNHRRDYDQYKRLLITKTTAAGSSLILLNATNYCPNTELYFWTLKVKTSGKKSLVYMVALAVKKSSLRCELSNYRNVRHIK